MAVQFFFRRKRFTQIAMVAISAVAVASGQRSSPGTRASPAPQAASDRQSVAGSKMEFEVASIQRWDPRIRNAPVMVDPGGRVSIGHATLNDLIAIAFNGPPFQVLGGDKWTRNVRYDIEAKAPEDAQWKMDPRYGYLNIEDERLRRMLQSLLTDRFQLKFHRETKTGDVYLLEKSGKSLKLTPTKAFTPKEDSATTASDPGWAGIIPYKGWILYDVSMRQLADFASAQNLYKPVYDRTGLIGRFDYRSLTDDPAWSSAYQSNPTGAFLDLVRDLGLKLVPVKGPVETFVIDHVEQPSPN
jgi:uncharacterized protein (TIGR03435 family)